MSLLSWASLSYILATSQSLQIANRFCINSKWEMSWCNGETKQRHKKVRRKREQLQRILQKTVLWRINQTLPHCPRFLNATFALNCSFSKDKKAGIDAVGSDLNYKIGALAEHLAACSSCIILHMIFTNLSPMSIFHSLQGTNCLKTKHSWSFKVLKELHGTGYT